MNKLFAILTTCIGLAAGACAPTAKTVYEPAQKAVPTVSSSIPKAVIYKTNGDYNTNVAINLNQTRDAIVSYPAPGDVSVDSEPVVLADGYLLDRRGVGQNTAFISLTYPEYSKLSSAPSPEALMKLIIPEARITSMVRLPMTTAEAMADTMAVNNLIRSGLPGCKVIFAPLILHIDK